MDTFNWALLLLSVLVLSVIAFGWVISVRLGSIDESVYKAALMLEHNILPRLEGLTSTALGTTRHEIRAIRKQVDGMPAKLDQLADRMSAYRPNEQPSLQRGPLKRVGAGDVLSEIANDLSTIKTYIPKK